jgi:AraC-like DNA-binding protein
VGSVLQADFEARDSGELVESLGPVAPGLAIAPMRGGPFRAQCDLVRTPRVGLFAITLGETRVLHTRTLDYYSVTFPTSGAFEVVDGAREERFGPGCAHALASDAPLDLRSHMGTRMRVANLDRSLVEPHLQFWNAEPAEAAMASGSVLRTDAGAAARLAALTAEMWAALRDGAAAEASPLALAELEDRLAQLLVEAWLEDEERQASSGPRCLQRAEEYLAEHLEEAASLAQVAEAAGTSIRSLTRAFRAKHGVSPMRFLRLRRLDAVHRELLEATPESISVTNVALRYGFSHLGRFAAEFRRHCGDYPSETLARSWPTRTRARPFDAFTARWNHSGSQ